jgi:spermidine synthase
LESKYSKKQKSRALKVALFATGISGIVAEYILSTLASYFIGNAVMQFTLIVSIMLFSMGLGSRLSKWFTEKVIFYFLITELVLSVFVSFSALMVYMTYSYGDHFWVLIYLLSIIVGLLIGLEIPFATRINDSYENLRLNISSILEKDYFGSLIGGLFFAFVGLPYLGLTYTPFALGFLNLFVSFYLFRILAEYLSKKNIRLLYILYSVVFLTLILGVIYAKPIVKFGEQKKYKDKIIYTKQTKYQKIILTEWQDWHSLYINGNQQLSTFDEFLYHEPMAHVPLLLHSAPKKILILGGGDGCLLREVFKHQGIEKVDMVDLDAEMLRLGKEHPVFLEWNNKSMQDERLKTFAEDGFQFLERVKDQYDIIYVDLPDPNNVDINKLYTKEFYKLVKMKLKSNGILISQSGSPYYATRAFYCIEKTMNAAGFFTYPMHNQVLTLGEWGWIIATNNEIPARKIENLNPNTLTNLKWLNKDAISLLFSFGKPLVDTSNIEVNTIFHPTLYGYYKKGNWNLY